MDPLDEFFDDSGDPFSLVHTPSKSTIARCEQYPQHSSIQKICVTNFLCHMVDGLCASIPEYFPLSLVHVLLAALILSSLLPHIFLFGFSHVLTF